MFVEKSRKLLTSFGLLNKSVIRLINKGLYEEWRRCWIAGRFFDGCEGAENQGCR
jgi:hypothetical protein